MNFEDVKQQAKKVKQQAEEVEKKIKNTNDLIEVTIQDTERSAKIFTQISLLVHEANKIIDMMLEENKTMEFPYFLSDELVRNANKWKERAQVIAENIEKSIKYAKS